MNDMSDATERYVPSEDGAKNLLRAALYVLGLAQARSEAVGYGSEVMGPLHQALTSVQYALDVAEGRT